MNNANRKFNPNVDPIQELHGAHKRYERLQADVVGFDELARILKDLTGINLRDNDKNQSLMASRLSSVLQGHGLETYGEYLQMIKSGDKNLVQEFISSLTTNTTQFFREGEHFEVLKRELPLLLERKRKAGGDGELRVWCAAASTGQEPYTIAMSILDVITMPMPGQVKFIATDIDDEVLERSCRGAYNEAEMASLPPLYRQKYFEKVAGMSAQYRVKRELRDMIRFAKLNLSVPFPFQHKFDIIFCRNVLIYFELTEATAVVEKLGQSLASGGILFLGHSESGTMRSKGLQTIGPATFLKGKGGVR